MSGGSFNTQLMNLRINTCRAQPTQKMLLKAIVSHPDWDWRFRRDLPKVIELFSVIVEKMTGTRRGAQIQKWPCDMGFSTKSGPDMKQDC